MGGELAERLREQNPRLKVIYTSGYSPGMAGKDISLMEGATFYPSPTRLANWRNSSANVSTPGVTVAVKSVSPTHSVDC